jgi:hypothetical protein
MTPNDISILRLPPAIRHSLLTCSEIMLYLVMGPMIFESYSSSYALNKVNPMQQNLEP